MRLVSRHVCGEGAAEMFIALERLLNQEDGYRQVFQLQGRSLLLMVVEGRT
ncbi:hypothetical protein PSEUDO8BK_30652 [Pseudomonas sp. 8BK]|nr:hypothetical protein PSEUDO8BK_30652 [Pseudomonas sp. 8BK]